MSVFSLRPYRLKYQFLSLIFNIDVMLRVKTNNRKLPVPKTSSDPDTYRSRHIRCLEGCCTSILLILVVL